MGAPAAISRRPKRTQLAKSFPAPRSLNEAVQSPDRAVAREHLIDARSATFRAALFGRKKRAADLKRFASYVLARPWMATS
jgi:hypothetical protein